MALAESNKMFIKAVALLLLAGLITFIIPKNQGAIDVAIHDTYWVINSWHFALGLWALFLVTVVTGMLIKRRLINSK